MADDGLVARPVGPYRSPGLSDPIITELPSTETLTSHKPTTSHLLLPATQINASTTMLYNHVLPYYHPSNYSSLSCYSVSESF